MEKITSSQTQNSAAGHRDHTAHLYVPHLHNVDIELNPQRHHVHSANSDALGAVEPSQLLVGGRIGGGDHDRWEFIELVSKRSHVAIRTKVEDTTI